jgi:hypothetical protein
MANKVLYATLMQEHESSLKPYVACPIPVRA